MVTIPESSNYRITAYGAGYENALGACVRSEFYFKQGKKLVFVIGQQGSLESRGGCGATVVAELDDSDFNKGIESKTPISPITQGPMSPELTSPGVTSPEPISPRLNLTSTISATTDDTIRKQKRKSRSSRSAKKDPVKDQPKKPLRRKLSQESIYPASTMTTAPSTGYSTEVGTGNEPNDPVHEPNFFFGEALIVAGGGGRNSGGDRRLSNASRSEYGHNSGRINTKVD